VASVIAAGVGALILGRGGAAPPAGGAAAGDGSHP